MNRVLAFLVAVALVSLGSAAFGVPAGPTHHSGMLDSSEVWLPSGNPHILDDDVFTADSVTLTIMPGCTVLVSADAELYTGYATPGSIVAVGTPDSIVTFTSLSDTVPGFWRSISFYSNTMSTARMSYCNVLFGGKTSDQFGAITVDQTGIKFDHNVVRKSGSNGVWLSGTGCFGDFSNNTIAACTRYAVHIAAEYVPTLGTGNTLTGNTREGVLVRGGTVKTTGTWLYHGVPYVINGDVAVQDATNSPVLTLAAGTTLKLTPMTEFYIGYSSPGGLIADGTGGQITFTSSIASPAPGDWVGLSFYANSIDSQCLVKNCRIEYGGAHYGDIYIDNCTPTVIGDSIGHSLHYGIYLAGSEYPDPDSLRADNYIYDYVDGDINIPTGVEESFKPQAVSSKLAPTILSGARGVRHLASCVVFDAMGRRVTNPKPGVYFVRQASSVRRDASSVTKVVVQH